MSAKGLSQNPQLLVHGKPLPREIQDTVITTSLNRTTEGASTLEIVAKDPDKRLQKAKYFEEKAEAHLDDLAFVACNFTKRGVDEYTLQFEDREFHELKEGPKSKEKATATRGPGMTLAHFVKIQCKRICPHADFVCPQIDEVQPVEAIAPKRKKSKAPSKGIAPGSAKIGGVPLTPDQEKVANELLEVVNEEGGNETVAHAIIYAGIGETRLGAAADTYVKNSAGCWGVLQSKDMPNPHDTKGMARNFCHGGQGFQAGGAIHLSKTVTNPEQIAVEVEVPSIWPSNAYANEGGVSLEDAKNIVKAFGGGSSSSKTTKSKTVTEALVFEINPHGGSEGENALSGMEELLKPGLWQFYKIGNTFYLLTEKQVVKTKVGLELDERTPGVIAIEWELDYNEQKKVWKVQIECRAQMWTPEPGTVVKFKPSVGKELSQGRWITQTIERPDITDNTTQVTLILPEAGKPEAPDTQRTVTSHIVKSATDSPNSPGKQQVTQSGPNAGNLKEDSVLYNCLFNAKWVVNQHFPYVWGGGHGGFFGPTTGLGGFQKGFDCSGAVSYVLGNAHAGLLSHPYDAEGFEFWGEPGKGKYMTVWASSSHVFLEFNVPTSLGPQNTDGGTIYFAATHAGTLVGFYGSKVAAGFSSQTPRHWRNL